LSLHVNQIDIASLHAADNTCTYCRLKVGITLVVMHCLVRWVTPSYTRQLACGTFPAFWAWSDTANVSSVISFLFPKPHMPYWQF